MDPIMGRPRGHCFIDFLDSRPDRCNVKWLWVKRAKESCEKEFWNQPELTKTRIYSRESGNLMMNRQKRYAKKSDKYKKRIASTFAKSTFLR